jgi:hypothetical protein
MILQAMEYEAHRGDINYSSTLESLIGSENAGKWEKTATTAISDHALVELELKGPHLKISAIYDPESRKVLDLMTLE